MNGPVIRLNRTDIEALELMSLGLTDKQMAKQLGLKSWHTASSRVGRAQMKIGGSNRAHAVALAITAGLIRGPEAVAVVAGEQGIRLADVAHAVETLKPRGLSHREIAQSLRMKLKTLYKAISRARRAGLLPPAAPRRRVAS